MKHADTIRLMIDAIQRGDAEAYADLYAVDAVMHHPLAGAPVRGRAAIGAGEQVLFDAFSDVRVELLTLVGTSRSAAVEVVLRATHTGPLEVQPGEAMPPTQRQIELPAAWFLDFDEGGLITVERDYFDTATLMSQLGL
jgi:ketosteroid isomerase-like protein